ncbi:POTE ankyrin domain family member I [Manis javanica]|nr:POTE ankyrin domain family member I [Manis javanica]
MNCRRLNNIQGNSSQLSGRTQDIKEKLGHMALDFDCELAVAAASSLKTTLWVLATSLGEKPAEPSVTLKGPEPPPRRNSPVLSGLTKENSPFSPSDCEGKREAAFLLESAGAWDDSTPTVDR